MAYKIAFYDTKPYDEHSFTEANEKFGFDIRYYKGHLNLRLKPRKYLSNKSEFYDFTRQN